MPKDTRSDACTLCIFTGMSVCLVRQWFNGMQWIGLKPIRPLPLKDISSRPAISFLVQAPRDTTLYCLQLCPIYGLYSSKRSEIDRSLRPIFFIIARLVSSGLMNSSGYTQSDIYIYIYIYTMHEIQIT